MAERKSLIFTKANVLCVFLSFLLTFMFVVVAICSVAVCTVFSRTFVDKSFIDTGFYDAARENLYDNMVSMLEERRLDTTLVDKCVDFDAFRFAIAGETATMFDKRETPFDVTEFSQNLRQKLDAEFTASGMEKSETYDEGLDTLVGDMTELYAASANQFYADPYRNARTAFLPVLYIAFAGSAIACALLIIALIKAHQRRYVGRYFVAVSAIGATICCAVPFFALEISGITERIGISPAYFRELLAHFMYGVADGFLVAAAIFAAAAIVSTVSYFVLRRHFHDRISHRITD